MSAPAADATATQKKSAPRKVMRVAARAEVVKNDEVYQIVDYMLAGLEPLTLSTTDLRAGRSTRGHSHPTPEVYIFYSDAVVELGQRSYGVKAGQMLVVKGDEYHRIYAPPGHSARFLSLFWGERDLLKPNYERPKPVPG